MAYYPFAIEKGAVYTLVGPDGSTAVFNDPNDPNYVGMITDIAGLGSADVRESAQDLTEADGGSHGSFYFARQPVVITASIFGHGSVAERTARIDRARRASLALRGDAVLSWRPSTRVENLASNPGAEVDASGAQVIATTGFGTGFAVTRSTTSPIAGTGSLEFSYTPNATNASGMSMYAEYWQNVNTENRIRVGPGDYVAARLKMKVRGGSGMTNLGATMAFRGPTGTFLGNATYSSTIPTPVVGTTYDFVLNGVAAPAGTVWCQPLCPITGGLNTTPLIVQMDSNLITKVSGPGVAPPAYFDGNTAGFMWQGDANVSQSADYVEMYTTLRRQQRFQESGDWVKEIQIPMVSEYATVFSIDRKTLTATSGTAAAVENRGNYTSYPVLEWTGAGTNPRATTTVGGDFRTTTLTLAAGEKVEFDMLNHTGVFTAGARAGQSANRFIDFLNTNWVGLPGAATTNVTNVAGSGTMRVLWRDVWA